MTAAMLTDPHGRALVAAIHERKHRANRPPGRNTVKALGLGLMALPIVLFMLGGLIFDTADFLGGMGIVALIILPMAAGCYLWMGAGE